MTAREERAREVLEREAIASGDFASISFGDEGWNPWVIAVRAMLSFADQPLAGEEGDDAEARKLAADYAAESDWNGAYHMMRVAHDKCRRAAFAAGMLRAAEIAERVASESRLVDSAEDSRIQHRGIIAGARACAADIRQDASTRSENNDGR